MFTLVRDKDQDPLFPIASVPFPVPVLFPCRVNKPLDRGKFDNYHSVNEKISCQLLRYLLNGDLVMNRLFVFVLTTFKSVKSAELQFGR